MEQPQSNNLPKPSDKCYLPRDHVGPNPDWLAFYKAGKDFYFANNYESAEQQFKWAASVEGCPNTVYLMLYVLTQREEYFHKVSLRKITALANDGVENAEDTLRWFFKHSNFGIHYHLWRTKIVGDWLFNPVGLFLLLSVVAGGALANFLDPLWFTQVAPIFVGVGLAGCVIGVIGLALQLIGASALKHVKKKETEKMFKVEKSFSFSDFWQYLNYRYYCAVIFFGVLLSIGLILAIFGFDALTPVIDTIARSLSALSLIPGLEFMEPLSAPGTSYALAIALFVLAPVILVDGIWRMVTTQSDVDSSPFLADVELPEEQEAQDDIPVVSYTYTEEEQHIQNEKGYCLVQALFPYAPDNPNVNQLTFEPDDKISVIASDPKEDWWVGQIAEGKRVGERGYFPTNFVQILKNTPSKTPPQYEASAESGVVFSAGR